MKVTKEISFQLNVTEVATWFSELSTSEQADFFTEVTNISEQWGTAEQIYQWHGIGRILKHRSKGARDMIEHINEAINENVHV